MIENGLLDMSPAIISHAKNVDHKVLKSILNNTSKKQEALISLQMTMPKLFLEVSLSLEIYSDSISMAQYPMSSTYPIKNSMKNVTKLP